MRFWLLSIGAGLTSALLYGGVISTNGWGGTPASLILVYFAQLPLMLIGLSFGSASGIIAGATGIIALFVAGGAIISGGFALGSAFPSALVSRQALLSRSAADGQIEWYPLGSVLAWLVLWGAAVTSVILLVLFSQQNDFPATLQVLLSSTLQKMAPHLSDADRHSLATTVSQILPGVTALSWLAMTVVNACLAQAIAKKLSLNMRQNSDISTLQLPRWLLIALAASALLGLLGSNVGYMAQNLLLIFLLPLFLVGLAVIHVFARQRQTLRPLILGISYGLIVIIGWPAVLVTGIGLIDQLVGLRQRMTGLA